MKEDIRDTDIVALNKRINVDSPVGPSTADRFARTLTPGRLPSTQDQRDQTDSSLKGGGGVTLPIVKGTSGGKGWSFGNPVISAAKSFLRPSSVREGVKIDNKEGLGSTPWNSEVGYMGFTVHMKPHEFLALNPPRGATKSHAEIKKAMQGGAAIGSPFIQAEWHDASKSWKVFQHEGRGRMLAAHELHPDEDVPVHVFPRGQSGELRARHLTDQHLFAPIHSDIRRGARAFKFTPTKVLHDGKEKHRSQSVAEIVDALVDEGVHSEKWVAAHPNDRCEVCDNPVKKKGLEVKHYNRTYFTCGGGDCADHVRHEARTDRKNSILKLLKSPLAGRHA